MVIKKPDLTKEQLIKQYNSILVALQGLYTDCHNTADRLNRLEEELMDIKKTLIELLKNSEALKDFEKKIFRDNLSR